MEIRTTSSTGAEKGVKQERYDLIPVNAMATVARLYGRGADKYAAHNWRKGYEWSKSYAALQRHANLFWNGEDIDPEMQVPHMAAVVFHALALITFMEEQPGFDDRFIAEVAEQDTFEEVAHQTTDDLIDVGFTYTVDDDEIAAMRQRLTGNTI